jgi:Protein of unknown function (DUF2934)
MPSTRTATSRPSKGAPVRKTRSVPAPTEPAAASDTATRDAMIRIAAYSFYERRGFVGGHELEDWLQAEMEVDRQLAETGTVPKPEPAK